MKRRNLPPCLQGEPQAHSDRFNSVYKQCIFVISSRYQRYHSPRNSFPPLHTIAGVGQESCLPHRPSPSSASCSCMLRPIYHYCPHFPPCSARIHFYQAVRSSALVVGMNFRQLTTNPLGYDSPSLAFFTSLQMKREVSACF